MNVDVSNIFLGTAGCLINYYNVYCQLYNFRNVYKFRRCKHCTRALEWTIGQADVFVFCAF